jgi:hypothetical protein
MDFGHRVERDLANWRAGHLREETAAEGSAIEFSMGDRDDPQVGDDAVLAEPWARGLAILVVLVGAVLLLGLSQLQP